MSDLIAACAHVAETYQRLDDSVSVLAEYNADAADKGFGRSRLCYEESW